MNTTNLTLVQVYLALFVSILGAIREHERADIATSVTAMLKEGTNREHAETLQEFIRLSEKLGFVDKDEFEDTKAFLELVLNGDA